MTDRPAPASPAGPAPDDGLVEALRPFAAIADEYDDAEDDDFQVWKDFDVLGASLPLKNFRRARAALRAHTAQPAAGVLEPADQAMLAAVNDVDDAVAAYNAVGSGSTILRLVVSVISHWSIMRPTLTAALAAAPRAHGAVQSVPEGWRLVPIEPTEEMLSVFHKAISVWMSEIGEDADVWRDMLAAAPMPGDTPK